MTSIGQDRRYIWTRTPGLIAPTPDEKPLVVSLSIREHVAFQFPKRTNRDHSGGA